MWGKQNGRYQDDILYWEKYQNERQEYERLETDAQQQAFLRKLWRHERNVFALTAATIFIALVGVFFLAAFN